MSENILPDIRKLVEYVQLVERPKWTPKVIENEKAECPCGKRHLITPDMWFETGVRRGLDPACPECAKAYAKEGATVRLVCVTCRPPQVITRFVPGREPKSGLVIRPNGFLHGDCCPLCRPGVKQTVILEQMLALRRQGKSV